MRYFISLAYDGTNFKGWQRQKNTKKTVQETIETKLSEILKATVSIYGCGRTDAGVHASQFYAQINTEIELAPDLLKILNHRLPESIKIYDIFLVPIDAHVRYSATRRTYNYFIHLNENPFLSRFSSYYKEDGLNVPDLKKAVALIQNYNDFASMCKQPDKQDNTICKIFSSECEYISEDRLRISITANRFLRGLIRILVMNALDVGYGQLSLEDFQLILDNKMLRPNKKMAFPQGLHLTEVQYPFLSNSD